MNSNDIIRKSGQKFYKRVLANGLTVCMFPKPSFQRKFAMYAVNFGSQDSKFSDGNNEISIPAGMAHFLEHKVFEQEDGDALQKFSKLGSSPNAFTSQTMTAYHFECTDKFFENLEILLGFVNTPYFTKQNVAKEQGIIGQEIGMVNDSADWRAYTDLFAAMLPNHTISQSVIGTVESIAQITPEILKKTHELFYRPSNMVLTVAGDVDFDKVCETAEKIVSKKPEKLPKRIYNTGLPTAPANARASRKMDISIPSFLVGFHDIPPQSGAERGTHILTAQLAAEYLCGQSSPLFSSLYKQNLIDRDFSSEYSSFAGGGMLVMGGESRNPEAVRTEIFKEIDRVKKGSFDAGFFERIKKASYGMKVRYFDSPEALCQEQAFSHFMGMDFLNFPDFYEHTTAESVSDYICSALKDEVSGMSVVYPVNSKDEANGNG